MAWVLNGEVEAISGSAALGDGTACVWLLGSDALFGSAKWQFVRHSRPEVERLTAKWGQLVGYVHAANTAHVRWLKWCGFELSDPVTRGAKAELFYPFQRLAHV